MFLVGMLEVFLILVLPTYPTQEISLEETGMMWVSVCIRISAKHHP